MRTVFEHFIEYYQGIRMPLECSANVKAGIYDYLQSIGLAEIRHDSEKIACRELTRFRLMPLETFEMFFANYQQRTQIEQLIKDCEILAIDRADSGRMISRENYIANMNRFYSLSAPFASKKNYAGWLNDKTGEIEQLLKYASGISDIVPDLGDRERGTIVYKENESI